MSATDLIISRVYGTYLTKFLSRGSSSSFLHAVFQRGSTHVQTPRYGQYLYACVQPYHIIKHHILCLSRDSRSWNCSEKSSFPIYIYHFFLSLKMLQVQKCLNWHCSFCQPWSYWHSLNSDSRSICHCRFHLAKSVRYFQVSTFILMYQNALFSKEIHGPTEIRNFSSSVEKRTSGISHLQVTI